MERKTIIEEVCVSDYEFDNNLENYIKKLSSSIPKKYIKDAYIDITVYDNDFEEGYSVHIHYNRLETDGEFNKRKVAAEKRKDTAKVNKAKRAKKKDLDEKKLYEKLKAKYEK